MSQKRDTDYLAVSTRIHAMENRMLTRERMERMIDAKDSGEAAKVLSECGYGELTQLTSAALEELLADGTHSRSSKFSEFADCFSRNKRSFLYEASMTKDEYLHILAYHVVNTSYGGSLESFIKHYQN